MASVELVRAVGEQQHHGGVPKVAHEEAQQVARRSVGPVQILDDQHDRTRRRQAVQDAEQQLEQPALGRAHAQRGRGLLGHGTEIRDKPRKLRAPGAEHRVELLGACAPDQPAQRLGHGGVRHRALTEIDAAAGQHDGSFGFRQLGERGEKPRLADPGLARDDGGAAPPVVGEAEGVLESPELGRTAD